MRSASVVEAVVGSEESLSEVLRVEEMPSATPIVVGMAARVRRPRTMVGFGTVWVRREDIEWR